MILNPHLLPKIRSERLMQECGQMPCTLRIAGFIGKPCAGQDTVVGCHLPVFGKGISTKVSDLFVVAGCATCHSILDGKAGADVRQKYPHAFWERLTLALCETQARWVMAGLIQVPDAEIV